MCIPDGTFLCTDVLASVRSWVGRAFPSQQHAHSPRADVSVTLWPISHTYRTHTDPIQDSDRYIHADCDSQRDAHGHPCSVFYQYTDAAHTDRS